VRLGIDVHGQTAEMFCEYHSCFKCVQTGQTPALEAQDGPPRNVCCNHQLCCVPQCRELALPGDDYCAAHATPQCQHVYPNGFRCAKPAIAQDVGWCEDHISLFHAASKSTWDDEGWCSDESMDEDAEFRGTMKVMRCAGKNKKGKPCGSPAMPNSEYCHAHAPPATSFTQLQEDNRIFPAATKAQSTDLSTSAPSNAPDTANEEPPSSLPDEPVAGDPLSQENLSQLPDLEDEHKVCAVPTRNSLRPDCFLTGLL
jgi:hypothetical protein